MDKFCTFYIVRHGESVANALGVTGGQMDFDITEKGKRQASELSEVLKSINFDAIYSSDLARTVKTAEILAEDRKLAVLTSKFLREKSSGKFEGQLADEVKIEYEKLKEIYSNLTQEERLKFRIDEDAETDEEEIARFIPFIRELAVAYLDKTILIVTHAHIQRTFLIHLGYAEKNLRKDFDIKNGAIIKVISDGVDFEVQEVSKIF